MAFENPGDGRLRQLLQEARRIAVVGLSPRPDRDSNHVAAYLQQRGYENVPVYPREEEAAARAREAGLTVVMDRCLKVEHARLLGPGWQRG